MEGKPLIRLIPIHPIPLPKDPQQNFIKQKKINLIKGINLSIICIRACLQPVIECQATRKFLIFQ
jgi:hypothetical protein